MDRYDPREYWGQQLRDCMPDFLARHPVLSAYHARCGLLLHGSTCREVDDALADLDLYLVLERDDLARLDADSSTRFFEISVAGKPGHINAISLDDVDGWLSGCELPHIDELRISLPIVEGLPGLAARLERARRPMTSTLRRAFFFHHYVWMRNYHRAGDNPMGRGASVAVLLAVPQTVAHALRAALVLDGKPYPYEKWLYTTARRHPTGRRLAPHVEALIDALDGPTLRSAGPEEKNPLSQALRRIRLELIEAAQEAGIDEPWLIHWYHQIDQARDATAALSW